MSRWIQGSESASGYNPHVTVQQQCDRWADTIVAEVHKDTADSGWSKETPYAQTHGRQWDEFMLAGGGPSVFLRICYDTSGDPVYAVVQYSEGNQAFAVLSRWVAERALRLLKRGASEAADPDGE